MSDVMVSDAEPIACSLGVNDSRDRFAWIAELNRDALRSYERRGLVLEIRYASHAIERVREMVRREQECCSFLIFGLHEEPQDVRLTITAPERAREAADVLFEQFIVSTETAAGCGCAPTPPKQRLGVAGKAAGGVAIVGAVAACAVCVVPFALPAVLLAGAGGVLAWLDNAQVWITGISVIALAIAWLWVWRQSARSRRKPAASTLTMMGVATFLVASALFWREIEPEILRIVGG